jgi:channel protein (hemolysin III family)
MDVLRDPVSSASHFLMAAVAVFIGLFLQRVTAGDRLRQRPVMVFTGCMVLLYMSSGLYHAVRVPADERVYFQLLDLSAIYLMIAGSVTPVAAILVRGRMRSILLIGEWGLASIGIACLWLLPRPSYEVLIAGYAGMVWLAFAGAGHYWRATGWAGAGWTMATVAIYSTGAVADWLKWPVIWPGVIQSHEIMHLCDIGGTACYLVFLIRFVIPDCPANSRTDLATATIAVPAQA